MAYQKLFYFQYYRQKTADVHLVEIWKDTEDVITATEIKTNPPAFVEDMPELDNIFQVVRGLGFSMNLFSETDGQFFNSLYTTDPIQLMVKKYVNSALTFLGYIDPEIIGEPYDYATKYGVNLTGNDGLGLLDRFYFVQSDDSHYTGIKSKWELLIIALNKIGLPWVEIRCKLATTFTEFSGDTDSTILHESYVDCANFYDEDDNPLTLRQVVDSILSPYGAFMLCENSHVYICDIHTFAGGGTITFQRFTYSTEAYIANIGIAVEKTVQSIGFLGTGQRKERSGGFNKQVVAYSPYPIKDITDGETIVGTEEFGTVPGSWSTKNGYYYKTLALNESWTETTPATFEASYNSGDSSDNANIYSRYPRQATDQKVFEIKINPWLNIAGATTTTSASGLRKRYLKGVAVLITGEILTKTKNNPYDDTQTSKKILTTGIKCRMKCGDRYFTNNPATGGIEWMDTDGYFYIHTTGPQHAVIADSFVSVGSSGNGYLAIVGNRSEVITINGELEFEIYSDIKTNTQSDITYTDNSTDVQEVWIRNIELKIVDLNRDEISDDDIEYTGILNKQFKNEGETVTLYCGTNSQFSDRGKILKYDGTNYSSIYTWTRNGQTYKIEELLLGSLSSNYQSGLITLTNMPLKCNFGRMNIITDSNISGVNFMVKEVKFNAESNVADCTLVEIRQDELTIVKE